MKELRNAGWIALAAMALSLATHLAKAQVGIGTETPQAKLHVHDGSIMGTVPDLPASNDPFYDPATPIPMQNGFRWLHDKSALRSVGERVGTGTLDPQNIGTFSFSSGYENLASGTGSTALGLRSIASGVGSLASGTSAQASGSHSIAVGYYTNASGTSSVAMGEYASALANYSCAVGYSATADGNHSVAIGENIGNNKFSYSFVLGMGQGQQLKNTADKQMVMGFSGGYRLFSNASATIGVQVFPGGNSWSVISDVNKKENFSPVNGDDVLTKISKMNLTSWNYKGQDSKSFRHYGPMAQDFFAAFGKDEYGTIGADTTINQADFDGINLIAIQALIRKMEKINSDLLAEIAIVKAQLADVQSATMRKKKRVLLSKR